MTTLQASRIARRRALAFGILLGISGLLVIGSSTGPVVEFQHGVAFAFRPVQAALDAVTSGTASLVSTIAEIEALHRTNEELARENAQLAAENAQAREIGRENAALSALLKVKTALGYETVAGTVIGREASPFRSVLTLDVGTDREIRVDDVVVGEGGAVVGRVTDVTANSSTVLLINDESSTVIGQVGESQATGRVIGQLGGVLVMQDIDSAARIQIGDQVVTAGIDLGGGVRSPFPKGLVVGNVVDVEREANAVTQTAFIEPTASLDRLEYLLVITNHEGGLPPIEQQPIPCGSAGTLPEGEQPCVTPTPPSTPRP